MFYQGSLQEGIATAVQRNKTVVCFVTDGHEESQTWESDFLVDEEISDIIRTEAVALRLTAGSEEAGYLAAIFPLPKSPTLVILKNGELKEYISAGVTKEVFMQRTLNAFGRKRKPTPEPAASSPTQEQSSASIIAAALSAASSPVIRASNSRGPSPPPYSATAPISSSTSPPATADQPQSPSQSQSQSQPLPPTAADTTPASASAPAPPTAESTETSTQQPSAQAILAERAARLKALRAEEDRKAREAAAAAKKSNPSTHTPTSTTPTATSPATARQSEHAAAIRKQRAAEVAERNRILQQIQDDKEARRQRAADRSLSKQTIGSVAAALATPAPASSIDRAKNSHMAALQVRMEDGSSIRSRFSRDSTLAADVRDWVAEERAARGLADVPYGFKVLLAPLPNRMVEVAEEHQSLADLGLAPSATLILVAHGGDAATAYAAPAGVWGYILALYTWFMALVCSFLGIGAAVAPAATESVAAQQDDVVAAEASAKEMGQTDAQEVRRRRQQQAASRIRGFDGGSNDESRSDHQLYNGNSTNFEPRRDDDE